MAQSDEGLSESVATASATSSNNPPTPDRIDIITTSSNNDNGNYIATETNGVVVVEGDDENNGTDNSGDTNNNSNSNDNKTGGAVRGAIRSVINRATIGQLPKSGVHVPKMGLHVPKHMPKTSIPRQLPKITIKAPPPPSVSSSQSALSLLQKQKVPVKDVARISDRLSTGLQWIDTAQDVSSTTTTTTKASASSSKESKATLEASLSTEKSKIAEAPTTITKSPKNYLTMFQHSAYRIAVFTTSLVQNTLLGAAVFETYGSTVSYVATNCYNSSPSLPSINKSETTSIVDIDSQTSDSYNTDNINDDTTSSSESSTYYDSNQHDEYAIVPVSIHIVAGALAGTVHGVGGIVFEQISFWYTSFQGFVTNQIVSLQPKAAAVEGELIKSATATTSTATVNPGVRTISSTSTGTQAKRTMATTTFIRTKTSVSTGAAHTVHAHTGTSPTISSRLFNMKKFSLIHSGMVPTSILHHSIAHSVLFASYEGIKRTIINIQQLQRQIYESSIPINIVATTDTTTTTTMVPTTGLGSTNYLFSVGVAGGLAGLLQHVVSNYTEVMARNNVLSESTTTMSTMYRSIVTHISTTSLPSLRSCVMACPPSAIGFIAFEYGKQFSSN
jgi:hypothetical protein